MIRKIFLASAAACLFSTGAHAANAACPNVTLPQLQTALKAAVTTVTNGGNSGGMGFGLNMWATVVAPDGRVCLVADSSGDAIQGQWLASRAISAQKAFTAVSLSLGSPGPTKLALSTANLFSAVQPGGSLYGLQHSNPVAAAGAYGDKIGPTGAYTGPVDTGTYGTANDPMIGQVIGGINVFGGGLGLYAAGGKKVGGVGVSGDSSCQDHFIAWQLRNKLGLDHLGTVGGVGGDATHPDNIAFDVKQNPHGGTGVSQGGWGHPTCRGVSNSAGTTAANALPAVSN